MSFSKDKRMEIYKKSSEEVRELYGSTETGKIIMGVEESLGMSSEEDRSTFAIAIGDIILGLYKKESLNQILKDRLSLSDEQINEALQGLSEILDKIPEKKDPTPTVINLHNNSIDNKVSASPDPDLHNAHGYGYMPKQETKNEEPTVTSSQDDIFIHRKPNHTDPSTT